MAQIECKNLSVGYEGKVVRDNISFAISKGDYLCIVGENGSGKTTLMKTLLSLRKPMSGSIVFGDGLNKNEIGYIQQQTDVKNDFPATVYEIVLSGNVSRLGLRPFYNKEEKQLAIDSMDKMNILSLKDRCFRELSGGQRQRVLLARALTATKKVLLLDEPVSGLDPTTTDEMYELINKLNKEDKITIIMISHNITDVLKYATHILNVGSEVNFWTVDEYKKKLLEG